MVEGLQYETDDSALMGEVWTYHFSNYHSYVDDKYRVLLNLYPAENETVTQNATH